MRNLTLLFASTLLFGCAHQSSLPGSFAEDALIPENSVCHTFDITRSDPEYTCFVHSKQTDGRDASTSAARRLIVSDKLSAVCSLVTVTSDETFRVDKAGGTVWRLHAKCHRA